MLLVIDVGNSHTVSGLYDNEQLVCQWRLKTDRRKTADELAARFHSLLGMRGLVFNDISAVALASVVPTQQHAWVKFAEQAGWPLMVVGPGTRTGVKILIDNPAEVGADRLVNAVAALDRFHQALIVVDFGTAITFDCVSGNREYLGGAIVPGIAISLDALSMRTAKLPRVDISAPPPHSIGGNTVDAIKSGILNGYASLVDGMISKLSKDFGETEPEVIATGGMAEIIAPYTEKIKIIDPVLTLNGLRLIYEQNTPPNAG